MSLADNGDFHITISVEAPYEDYLYESSQLTSAIEDHLFDGICRFEDSLLSPIYPCTPLSSLPSSPESLYALDSSIAHSPLESVMKSPLSAISEDLGDPPQSTVAPRDVMSGLIDTLWSLPTIDQESNGHMEPLFGASIEDAPSKVLLAIDGLHPSIPSLSTLFSKQNLVDPDREYSSQSSTTISRHSDSPHTGLSALSPCLDSSSSPSQSLSILPPHKIQYHPRRSSVSSDSSLRVPTSPNRSSPRQHPYARPTADPGYAAAAEAASMTLEEYILIVEALQGEDTFKGWDWRSGLPELVKPVVGSPQTRRASEERRMDSATFYCPVQGCGSTVTKKHNLVYHLRSHFDPEPAYRCHICQKAIGHSASLKRHQRAHGPDLVGTNESKKTRGRKNFP